MLAIEGCNIKIVGLTEVDGLRPIILTERHKDTPRKQQLQDT